MGLIISKTPECEEFLVKILDGNPDVVRGIIRPFELTIEDSDPLHPIYEFLHATVRNDIREAAVKFGIGDAKKAIDEAIRAGAPPLVNAEQFRKRFHAFISAHDTERFLHSLSETPADEIIQSTVSSAPCFIRQLDLVDADIKHKTRAASDYLLATGDRTRWAEEGLVFEGSMNEYDSGLLRRHENLRTEVGLSHSALSAEQQGLLLYAKCCSSTQLPLEGRVVPDHFMPGSFNNLAERREIGWHADFDILLDDDT
ncbi:ABC-three component system protein [Leisingera sp. D0M16]|uniref:ABC-three component system protein n=1 Tax=Leisingera coralii TaxID=3351347 RepID=UPI003B7EE1F7